MVPSQYRPQMSAPKYVPGLPLHLYGSDEVRVLQAYLFLCLEDLYLLRAPQVTLDSVLLDRGCQSADTMPS
ncbi:hypothetical protein HETIRDRAFT_386004 [Heterobasidion irregulare TC 32-1]|uniref:Uncharacterized protein n=1 Tax=Heterobasidion irregulare (strain TC 32-1) TaxID=747525 RepID=W4K165_HETIT|nr:uncharacterized protein HETIRDRAFT_386004 [Heterobasidion irregulare TC 32-1]ETW79464.1 hypothetical protein HETIRDRAFT_386004 [Heterobasidion irregulare TC 32-1]